MIAVVPPGELHSLATLLDEIAHELRMNPWGCCEACGNDANFEPSLTARHEEAARESAALLRQLGTRRQ